MSCYGIKDPVPSIAGQAVAGGTISAPNSLYHMGRYFSKLNPLVDNLKYSKAKLTPLVDSLEYSLTELNSLLLTVFIIPKKN